MPFLGVVIQGRKRVIVGKAAQERVNGVRHPFFVAAPEEFDT